MELQKHNVVVLSCDPNPERAAYLALHQDYSAGFVANDLPVTDNFGAIVVSRLIEGDRGHYGPLEHASIMFGVENFSHAVMQQARTHRVGISFDVQSFRYTGQQLYDAACELESAAEQFDQFAGEGMGSEYREAIYRIIDKVFLVPESIKRGFAKTRDGKQDIDSNALGICLRGYEVALGTYKDLIECGVPYEDARSVIGYGVRQHWTVSFNMRSLMHFLDLRAKKDAQEEIRTLCDLMLPHFQYWAPNVAKWYVDNRWAKAKLSP